MGKAMNTGPVIAAIDLGPLTNRVLHHAVGFARLMDVPLKVLHVNADCSLDARLRVLNACLKLGPCQADFADRQIVIRTGRVSDAIAREAITSDAALVVMGSRGHNAVAKFILGSTSEAVLRNATTPVLLVPPIDMDIVSISDRVALTSGAVVAAVDLSEDSAEQLKLAAAISQIGRQQLVLMTVAKSRVTDHQASQGLRERARRMTTVKPQSLVVRRGAVAKEISRCALVEGSGLVVMGLRASPRGQPGAIASAVLKTGRAFVLAVPNRRAHTARAPARRLAMIATLLAALLLTAAGAIAQPSFPDVAPIVAFQRAADSYAFMHRQVERRLGFAHRRAGTEIETIDGDQLAATIRTMRSRTSPGELFTLSAAAAISGLIVRAWRDGCDIGELQSGTWQVLRVNGPATITQALNPCIVSALPGLPPELEFRSAAGVLVLVDTHADLVVDVLPGPTVLTEIRR
jgi:nucleotide-binding universal stress UspA family protein